MNWHQITLILLSVHTLFAEAAAVPQEVAAKSRLEPRGRKRSRPRLQNGKYFHEPGGSELGNHYDIRYFNGIQRYEDKQDTQVHMLRAYLLFFQEKGVETWLAHGTLLGWWWNGKMLPWDWDIDTQVSGSSLAYLGEHFNRTIHKYTSPDSDPPVTREYLLDVNPHSLERQRGDGLNIIDARWIDIRNGLYIDITGLSETLPHEMPGVWSCKNFHRYKTTDLYPMRETMYEGVVAKVPYAYDSILTHEYQNKALVLTEYEGHQWNPDLKEWIRKPEYEITQVKQEQEARQKEDEEKQKAREKEEENQKEAGGKTAKRHVEEIRQRTRLEKETSGLAHLRRQLQTLLPASPFSGIPRPLIDIIDKISRTSIGHACLWLRKSTKDVPRRHSFSKLPKSFSFDHLVDTHDS